MSDRKQYRAPRGVADVLPDDQPYRDLLRETAARVARSYG
jgi:histidyl-tRNA synthetase